MKKEFDKFPEAFGGQEFFGFSWLEYTAAVPSPLVVVTGYKSNGIPNATMQSWCTFTGAEGYHCVFSSVHKSGHMYCSIKETGCCVVNFPSADILDKCMDTIKNNGFNTDEITASGLTVEPSCRVNAPRIKECFMNMDCELEWERDLTENGTHAVICLKVTGISMGDRRYNNNDLGRYGETGYLYNIRSQRNPETGEVSPMSAGILSKYIDF